jgi:hypothetical protein
MKPIIISLSGKAEMGKTTSTNILQEMFEAKGKKCLKMSYGDYVKEIATKYYKWNGNKDLSGRALLQTIGNNFRFKNPNFWVHTVIRLVDILGNDYDYILIDDARFPNEVYCWQNNEYKVIAININRPNFKNSLSEEQRNDLSEMAMNDFYFDYKLEAENIEGLTNNLERISDMLERA